MIRIVRMRSRHFEKAVRVVSSMLGEPEDVTRDDIAEFMEWDSDEVVLLVAEDLKGGFVGFAAATFERWNKTGLIQWIGLEEEGRGRGIGSRMIERMAGFVKKNGGRKLYVNTGVANRDAISFYLKNGFLPEGIFRDWYHEGGDALWLALRVDGRGLAASRRTRRKGLKKPA